MVKKTRCPPGPRRAAELGHCLERPQDYVLRVRWDTLEDHEVGSRQSAQYQQCKQILHHVYDPFPTVVHFAPVAPPPSP